MAPAGGNGASGAGVDLTEGFVDDDGDGAGEVEGADVVSVNGDATDGIGMGGEQVVGKTFGFAPEDEGIAGTVSGLGVGAGTAGAVKEKTGGSEGLKASGPRGMDLHLDGIPVVEPGAAELGVGDFESQRFDKMETGAGGGAEAGDVAGVGRDFRVDEDDVERDRRPAEVEFSFARVGVFHGEKDRDLSGRGQDIPCRRSLPAEKPRTTV